MYDVQKRKTDKRRTFFLCSCVDIISNSFLHLSLRLPDISVPQQFNVDRICRSHRMYQTNAYVNNSTHLNEWACVFKSDKESQRLDWIVLCAWVMLIKPSWWSVRRRPFYYAACDFVPMLCHHVRHCGWARMRCVYTHSVWTLRPSFCGLTIRIADECLLYPRNTLIAH